MTGPTPNLPLLRAVLAQIDAHPERWNQKDYATRGECGTAFCVAGWAVHLTHPTAEFLWHEMTCDCEDCSAGRFTEAASRLSDSRSIDQLATEELGLTRYEAGRLFRSSNSRSEIQHQVEQIAARAGESL